MIFKVAVVISLICIVCEINFIKKTIEILFEREKKE